MSDISQLIVGGIVVGALFMYLKKKNHETYSFTQTPYYNNYMGSSDKIGSYYAEKKNDCVSGGTGSCLKVDKYDDDFQVPFDGDKFSNSWMDA